MKKLLYYLIFFSTATHLQSMETRPFIDEDELLDEDYYAHHNDFPIFADTDFPFFATIQQWFYRPTQTTEQEQQVQQPTQPGQSWVHKKLGIPNLQDETTYQKTTKAMTAGSLQGVVKGIMQELSPLIEENQVENNQNQDNNPPIESTTAENLQKIERACTQYLQNKKKQAIKNTRDTIKDAGWQLIKIVPCLIGANYAIRYVSKKVCTNFIRPKLIHTSSQKTIYDYFFTATQQPQPMICSLELQEELDTISAITCILHDNIRKNVPHTYYRNLMLYGPPGTGKTMFTQKLAERTGMDYVIINCAALTQLTHSQAIQELDALFAWANNKKGLIMLIHNADTTLFDRTTLDTTHPQYQLITNFLHHISTPSCNYMLIFGINHVEQIDPAIASCIDDCIHIPLPALQERITYLQTYTKSTPTNHNNSAQPSLDYCDDQIILLIAQQTQHFSYVDLQHLCDTIKIHAQMQPSGTIPPELITKIVHKAVEKQALFGKKS